MPRFRTPLLLALTLLALLVAGLLAAPGFVDWRAAKPRLEAELSQTLGRAVALDGDFSLHFLPRPWLMAEGVRVANRPEGSEPELLRVARLEMRLALWPLLSGNFEVESLRLQRPVLLLERLADDRGNWDGMATRELMSSPSRAGAISLSNVEVFDGELVWRDHLAGREERLRGLDAQVSVDSLLGPVSGTGRFSYQGQPTTFDLAVAAPDRHARHALRLELLFPDAGETEVQLTGYFQREETEKPFEGRVTVTSSESSSLLLALTGAEVQGINLGRLAARSSLTWNRGEARLEALEVDVAGSRLAGYARVWPEPGKTFELNLATRYLNLDGLVASEALGWPGLALSPQLSGTLSLKIERLLWREQSLKEFDLAARLEKGEMLVDSLSLALAGGGVVTAGGRLGLTPATQGFQGHVNAEILNLRPHLATLGWEVEHLASDRLRRLVMDTAVQAQPGRLRLTDLEAELDRSRVSGSIDISKGPRSRFDLTLAIDELDLDRYFDPFEQWQANRLRDVDLDLVLEAEELRARGRLARGVRVDAGLENGLFMVRNLEVAEIGGSRLTTSGRIELLEETPPLLQQARVVLDVEDTGRLLETLGVEAPTFLQQLGPLQLDGEVEASSDGARMHWDLQALDGEGTLDLEVAIEGEDTVIREGQVELKGFSAGSLRPFQAFPALAEESASFAARFSGNQTALRHRSHLQLADAVFELDGRVTSPLGGSPELHGELQTYHPEVKQAAQLFSLKYLAPASGELELTGQLAAAPGILSLENIEGRAGTLVFTGNLRHSSTPSEEFDVDLSLGEVKAGFFAGLLDALSPIAQWRDEQGQWSRQPLKHQGAEGPDLALRLSVAGLALDRLALDDLALVLRRRQKEWQLEHFEAAAGQGRLRAEGMATMDALRGLSIDGEIHAEAVPLSLLKPWLSTVGDVSGALGTTMAFKSAGASAAELVGSLSGTGEVEGSFETDDLLTSSQKGEGGSDLGDLLEDLGGRGFWFAGELSAQEGRITTPGVELEGSEGTLVAAGTLTDLPLRRADLEISLYGSNRSEAMKRLRLTGSWDRLQLRELHEVNGRAAHQVGEEALPRPAASDSGALRHRP